MTTDVPLRFHSEATERLNTEATGGDTSTRHFIIVCTRCCAGEQQGARLMSLLSAQLAEGSASGFCVAPARCMAGCGRPLTVAFSAHGKATYHFGDIEPDRDALHLLAFARLYRSLPDGWCNEGQRPPGLKGKTLSRIPAVVDAGGTR